MTCIHKNCIFVKQKNKDDSWRDLHEGKTVSLENGDEFKFLTNNFHYQINQSEASSEKSKIVDKTEKDLNDEQDAEKSIQSSHHDQIRSKTQKCNEKKKRQLPDWMIAAGSSGLSQNKEKPRLEDESYCLKSEKVTSKQKSESEEGRTYEFAHCVNEESKEVEGKESPEKETDEP